MRGLLSKSLKLACSPFPEVCPAGFRGFYLAGQRIAGAMLRRCVIGRGAIEGREHDTRKLFVWRSQIPDQRPTVRPHELPLLDVPEGKRERLSQPGSRQVGRL